jgi:hypothetical protein
MTKDEVLKQALEFCEFCWRDVLMNEYAIERLEQTITEIREALAQQDAESHLQEVSDFGQLQEQEPVAWQWLDTATFRKKIPPTGESECWNPLYTSPPKEQQSCDKREWVGLTQEEYQQIQRDYFRADQWRGIEAKLKELNT